MQYITPTIKTTSHKDTFGFSAVVMLLTNFDTFTAMYPNKLPFHYILTGHNRSTCNNQSELGFYKSYIKTDTNVFINIWSVF